MFTDIFSTFDPATSSLFSSWSTSLFWASNFLVIFIVQASLWTSPSQLSWSLLLPTDIMATQVNRTNGARIKGLNSLLTPLFLFMLLINLTGILPYVFSASSHFLFSLTFGFPLWLSLILSAAVYNPSWFTAALLPPGSPSVLNPFLACVEAISTLIRPLTLSLRLTANMTAGHVILTLISIYTVWGIMDLPIYSALLMVSISVFYTIFEMIVCLIQAYVFCLLLSLYADEHPTS
uniref:ATP synthase subunit a n=1 Tax=Pharyngocirrus uchidai TaxID=2498818 RepID=A0A7G9IX14_9ANNE|nr:ATP synthase F0 subunit 6 [Pharyngocirrus uchidai]QNM39908.1 ATP synthase F0 subunit 6 [Pharyngocirrus uchidai]